MYMCSVVALKCKQAAAGGARSPQAEILAYFHDLQFLKAIMRKLLTCFPRIFIVSRSIRSVFQPTEYFLCFFDQATGK